MNNEQKKIAITVALLVAMALLFAKNIFFGKKGRASAAVSGVQKTINQGTIAANLAFLSMVKRSENARGLEEALWAEAWGRDPFTPSSGGGGVSGGADHFILSGIVWDEKMPVAIVNQKLLRIGDTIDGCRVNNIGRSSVTVLCGEIPHELKLFHAQEPSATVETKEAVPS